MYVHCTTYAAIYIAYMHALQISEFRFIFISLLLLKFHLIRYILLDTYEF